MWLKYLLREREALRIVPVLCASFGGDDEGEGKSPKENEQMLAFSWGQ